MFGLRDDDISTIIRTLERYPEIDRALIFGSRAKGTYKPGSDIDIAIFGKRISFDTVASLKSELEELRALPYLFDVVDATHLDHDGLRDHIQRVGIELFRR